MRAAGGSRGAEAPAPTRHQAGHRLAGYRGRAAGCAAWSAGAVAGFAVYLRLAQTRAVNSDGAAQSLQAWDMLRGNPLLRGWTTSDVSFYTTEVPQYLVVELIRGLGAGVVHVAAALTYTLVVLLACLVAAGRHADRSETLARIAIAAGIMLAPQLGAGTNVLLSSPDHIGTSVPLLAAWLILDRARPRWYVPVLTSLLLAWAQAADSIVLIAGVAPLAWVCALRDAGPVPGAAAAGRATGVRGASAARPGSRAPRGPDAGGGRLSAGRRLTARWFEVALGAGALAGAGVGTAAVWLVHAAGGVGVRPLGAQLAPAGEVLGHNLPVAAQGLLLLPGADFFGLTGIGAPLFAVIHLAGAALAAAGIALAAWRFRRGDLVSQVLVAAIGVNIALFVVTDRVYAVSSAREIAPVLPFAAALAGRQLAGPLLVAWRARQADPVTRATGTGPSRVAGRATTARLAGLVLAPALVLAGAGYLAGLGYELTAPASAPQAAGLTTWLERHHLGTGLSGYWEASVVTLTSGGRVAVRPVNVAGGRVVPAQGEVRSDWFDPARSAAHYVVLFPGVPGYPGFTDQRAVRATFGAPARVYQAGPYTIWYWPSNLLADLRR